MGLWSALFGSSERKAKNEVSVSISPLAVIEGKVIAAFTKVRQDTSLLSSWIKYLKHKDLLHDQRHTKTQRELGEHKTLLAGLKAEVTELKTAIVAAKEAKISTETGSFPNLIRTKSEPKADLKRTYFENRVVSMLRSRKRDYVLKQILELAAKETHSTSEIEQIIVGEKALCGRTAFYDYMRELKHKRMVKQQEKGAKKVIFAEKTALEQVR